VQAIAEELDASQQRREMIAPAMLPVISRDADHYDSQIYAVCGGALCCLPAVSIAASDDPEALEPLLAKARSEPMIFVVATGDINSMNPNQEIASWSHHGRVSGRAVMLTPLP
jgi:hypothetical protein